MPISPERARLRARHNGLKSTLGPDHPRVLDAQRELAAAKLDEYIRKTVAEAPPLTDEQRDRLAGIFKAAA